MNFRLASVAKESATQAATALWRFPLALVSALLVCGTLIMAAESGSDDWALQIIALTAALGVPMGVWIVIACESRSAGRVAKLAAQAAGAVLLIAYWSRFPDAADAMAEKEWWRAGVLLAVLHLGVSIGSRQKDRAGFWSFNWMLFIRYWTGVLYAVVLYAGLALALASAVKLFGFEIEDGRYFQLWLALTFGFHPLFMLAGVPRAGEAEEVREPSRGLRIFAGGVLLPLVGIYMAILYPYAAKIAVTRAWPDGWVAWPVIGLATAGMLALLLVQPLALAGLRWAEWYAGRWFGRLLVPMALLLGAAVCVRAGDYGLTESRYAGLVLAAWLAGMGIYFGTGSAERRSLRVIPWSLLVLCAALVAGPWGLFGVAERSQLARLDRALAKYGLAEGGAVREREQALPSKEYDDVKSMIDYLHRRHRSEDLYVRMEPWLRKNPERRNDRWGFGSSVLEWLKVKRADDEYSQDSMSWAADDVALAGFTRAAFADLGGGSRTADALGVKLRMSNDGTKMEMETSAGWQPVEALNAKIAERVAAGTDGDSQARVPLWADITTSSGDLRRIVLLRAHGQRARTGTTFRFWEIDALVLAP